MTMILAALALAVAPVAGATQASPATVMPQPRPAPQAARQLAPAPERLAAARRLIDILMPPATRAEMMRSIMDPMMVNIRQSMTQNPQFASEMSQNPKVRAAFDRFMVAQQARSVAMVQASLPGMATAMAAAYARRFDVQQLETIGRFFQTPTGQAYIEASYTIMNDPDVAAWQRSMMTEAMSHVRDDVQAFVKDVAATQGEGQGTEQGEKKQ